jgi:molybdopterin synthase catalytic subunit
LLRKKFGTGGPREPSATLKQAPVRVKVLFFGVLREIAGRGEDCLDLPDGATLSAVFDHYAQRHPRLGEMKSSILLARNQQFSRGAVPVQEGDEIALLPPVSGGSGPYLHQVADPAGHFFALTRAPIDPSSLKLALLAGEDGAVAVFEGVTRNNTKGRRTLFLDYECYEQMAIRTLAELGRQIAAAHRISRIAMVHRLGRLEIGETSVAIVVTAPHRGPAFDACREAIDRLKRVVPIWKKEHFEDGEVWVEGDWDSSLIRT